MLGDIVKIVYFDEGSATDYCQIRSGGNVNTEAIASDSKAKGADGTVGASIGAKLTSLIPFINPTATVTAEGSAEASYHIETVVKSIVTNTVLTDFLSNVNDDDGRNVTLFEGKRIEQVPGSISSLIRKHYDKNVSKLDDEDCAAITTSDILGWFEKNAERYDNMRTLKTKIEKTIFEKLSAPLLE